VLLADASKLGRAAFVNVATADEIDVLVTDAAADHPTVRALSDAGVTVITV
jgi:DeoR family transcriptional regulator of aga operon